MATLNDLRARFRKVDLLKIVDECIIESKDTLLNLIRSQIEHGEDATGLLPEYINLKYSETKERMGSKAPFGITDLKFSGDFLKKLQLKRYSTNILIRSSDKKNSAILKRYGADINNIISLNKIQKDKIICGNTIFIPDAIEKKIIQTKKNSEKSVKTNITKNNKEIDFQWPLKGRITSAFGKRIDPISRRKRFHCGVDIGAPEGTPVKASAKGKVIFCQWKNGYGKVVVIKHKKGYITVYAHNKKNIVKENDVVHKGEIIAVSGMTGAVTGPHLHFEIRKYLTPLNPLRFLK